MASVDRAQPVHRLELDLECCLLFLIGEAFAFRLICEQGFLRILPAIVIEFDRAVRRLTVEVGCVGRFDILLPSLNRSLLQVQLVDGVDLLQIRQRVQVPRRLDLLVQFVGRIGAKSHPGRGRVVEVVALAAPVPAAEHDVLVEVVAADLVRVERFVAYRLRLDRALDG